MIKSNFEHIVDLNQIAGNGSNAGWEAADAQLKLIEDEFIKELVPAIHNRDIVGVRDGIADVLVTVYGLAWRMGIDADLDFMAVHESNMSKFDKSPQDQERTRIKYLKLGVDTIRRTIQLRDETYYVTVSATDQVGSDGKEYRGGKFLKSINYKEPEFPALSTMARSTLDLNESLVKMIGRRVFKGRGGVMYGHLTDKYSQLTHSERSAAGAKITFTRMAKGAEPTEMNVLYLLDPDGDGKPVHGVARAENVARLFFRLATDMPGDALVFVNKVTFWSMIDKTVEEGDSYEFSWSNPDNISDGVNVALVGSSDTAVA